MPSPVRILDFDIENRPLNYVGADFTYGETTAIAAGWCDEEEVHVWVLTKDERSRNRMIRGFLKMYNAADMVTGHFIRNHDLPAINGMNAEFGFPLLAPKMTCDTKNDLFKKKNFGGSQEYLAGLLGIEAPKVGMSQLAWRSANRLTKDGIELTKLRCVGDVIQHKAMRLAMLERGWLKGPKLWRP